QESFNNLLKYFFEALLPLDANKLRIGCSGCPTRTGSAHSTLGMPSPLIIFECTRKSSTLLKLIPATIEHRRPSWCPTGNVQRLTVFSSLQSFLRRSRTS